MAVVIATCGVTALTVLRVLVGNTRTAP